MNIVIDARALSWTGIGRYARALLDALQKQDHEDQYTVLMRQADWSLWEPSQANFTRVAADINPYSWGEQTKLAWLLYRLNPDVVHFLSFNAPLLYLGKHITTIHDLTLVDYKNWRGGLGSRLVYELKYWLMRIGLRIIIRSSSAIITPTEWTRQELIQRGYAGSSKITAIHHGAPQLPAVEAKPRSDDKPTLLYVGNLYPYKNLAKVIEALPALKRNHPGVRLVLVGQEDVFGAELRTLADKLNVADSLTLTGYVSDEELAGYYKNASVYVFPSLSEGFGLPPLEAMASELPVAAALASCLPEVLGKAAVYFDPHSADDIARVIDEVLSSPQKRKELQKAGSAHLNNFSWKRMAEQTLAVYAKAGEA